jgi:hypothetical protein
MDSNAFCRAKAVQLFSRLAECECIPLDTLRAGLGRLIFYFLLINNLN